VTTSSPAYTAIKVSVTAPTATVTLHRPEALNAITPTMLQELNLAFVALEDDPEVSVIVLTGEGRAFSAGVDLKSIASPEATAGGKVGNGLNGPAREFTSRVARSGKIVIAKVNGFCFTGALELAIACDIVVVAEEAKLGDTHAKWGLRPTWGMSQRLPMLVGLARARDLSYTARTFTGADAAAWGLFAYACPLAELDAKVADLAAGIAANSQDALKAYKDLYLAAERLPSLPEGLQYEYDTHYDLGDSAARVAGFSK
jgi:enoyl-CoA hydratase/carnithine racemase